MVDARFPEKLLADRRLLKLSAEDIVSYSMATIWSVSNRTDGCILADELALIPRFKQESASRLVTAELWKRHGAGYLILDFEAWQTSRSEIEQLERLRKSEREKKRRQRASKKSSSVPGTVPGTNEGTAQDRQGQDRQGQAQERKEVPAPITEWNVAPIGEGRLAS